MNWRNWASLAVLSVVFLAGCGRGSKQDIVKKGEKASTRAELEKALGKPDKFDKIPLGEIWTYTASDGEVKFTILGDKVTPFTITGDKEK